MLLRLLLHVVVLQRDEVLSSSSFSLHLTGCSVCMKDNIKQPFLWGNKVVALRQQREELGLEVEPQNQVYLCAAAGTWRQPF